MSNVFVSVFAKVVAAEHATVAWLEKELVRLEGEAPTIEKVVDTGIGYIGPVLEIALDSLGDVPAAALVETVVTKAQADLSTVSALITDFGPTPTAASIFSSVGKNLSALLTDAQITNTKSVSAVQKAVSEIGVLGQAITLAYNAIVAAATPAPAPAPVPVEAPPLVAVNNVVGDPLPA